MIDASIFENLQNIVDEEILVRDNLREVLKLLEKQCMDQPPSLFFILGYLTLEVFSCSTSL